MAEPKTKTEVQPLAMHDYTCVSHGLFAGTFVIRGTSFADACDRFTAQFRAQLVQVPMPVQSPTSKVGALLGKLNANEIHGYKPGQLKCVGANDKGDPLFRAKAPGWNVVKIERRIDPETGIERTYRVPVENFPSVEMPKGEVLADVIGSREREAA